MPHSHAAGSGLDARRRKLLFRSWHRGMLEMDLIMGRFADAEIAGLSDVELVDFEALLEASDPDVFSWVTGEIETPGDFDTKVFRKLRAFHGHKAAI